MSPDAGGPHIDMATIDWSQARRAVFEVRQTLEYGYPGPIYDLHHRLMLVPPDLHGPQRLLGYGVTALPEARPRYSDDQFGNRLCHVMLETVEQSLEFDVRLRVERTAEERVPLREPAEANWYTPASPLTEPSPDLRAIARHLAHLSSDRTALAEAINAWVHTYLTYAPGVTDVSTTARDAYSGRAGVCQDYAHLMIALCRILSLPARYVSGHLLGEGSMHAWVQVLLPAQDTPDGGLSWQPYDPTHGRRAGMPYITVAVGRDYGDVSPTRGSFRAPYAGWLTTGYRQAGVLELQSA